MNLNQFKSWKLLYEDNDICFSKAVNNMDQSNVFFITFFSPENMSIATKHLLENHLHNYVALIEEDDKLHLILKAQEGHPIKKFISKTPLDYDDRVQIVYEYFKLIDKYDAFPNAIKIQLLDEEQLLISDEGLSFRELIDYAPTFTYAERDVYKQLGKTIDLILHDAEGYHSQFIDNLLLGNHKFASLHASKENFKDIFIFEKPDALESINYEYTIIINDLEAGPPLKLTEKDIKLFKEHDHNHSIHTNQESHIPHDELQRELAEFLSTNPLNNSSNTLDDLYWPDTTSKEDSKEGTHISHEEIHPAEIITSDNETPNDVPDDKVETQKTIENKVIADQNHIITQPIVVDIPENVDVKIIEENSINNISAKNDTPVISPLDSLFTDTKKESLHVTASVDTKSFKAQFVEDDLMPEILPKSAKQRIMEESEEEGFDEDMAQLFEVSDAPEFIPTKRLWILLAVGALLLIVLGAWGVKTIFTSEPIAASFTIEALHDNRIAFMNTSTGEKKIKNYSWEIYYADTLVQTFTDENLFPVFDTEGAYKIVLKVQDKKGIWSEPYSEIYDFILTEETTTTP